jgi:pimeloyl-ACP methyl ester carboxylesterase
MLTFLLIPLLLYALACAAAFLLQDKMLFPAPPVRAALPPAAERLALRTPDGVDLAGLRLPADRAGGAAPLILGFGGNGWSADAAAAYLHDLYPQAEVFAFHYRGYPPSGGSASSRALQDDSLLVYDLAARRFPGRPIIAIGFSIGSGVAAHLAAHRPLAGLILVTPFDSLTAVSAAQLPFHPVRALFRNPMEPAAALRTVRAPTAILAGGRDTLVAPARTDALRRAARNLVYDRTIPDAGHNDIYGSGAFQQAMHEALATVLVSGS